MTDTESKSDEVNFDLDESDDDYDNSLKEDYPFFKTHKFFILFTQNYNIGVAHELWGKIDGSKQWINYADEHFFNRDIILYYNSLSKSEKDDVIRWYNGMLSTIDLGAIPEMKEQEIRRYYVDNIEQFKKESRFFIKIHNILRIDNKNINKIAEKIMKKVWESRYPEYFYKFKYNADYNIILFYNFLSIDEKNQFYI